MNLNEQNTKIKYRKSYVAFLDILGFKDKVKKNTVPKIRKIFDAISIIQYNNSIALHRVTDEHDEVLNNYNKALEECSIRIMSDSIVVSVPCDKNEALAVVIDVCKEIQLLLYDLDEPVFLRGAIAVGQFYINKDVMFGQAMVDAYLVQETISVYPRIIISDYILSEGIISVDSLNDIGFNGLERDETDGYQYIDTLTYWLLKQKEPKIKKSLNYLKLYTNIIASLADYSDKRIREKYLWLKSNLERAARKAESINNRLL